LFAFSSLGIPRKFIEKSRQKNHSQPIVALGFISQWFGKLGFDPTFHASLDLSTRFSASNVPKRKPMTSLRLVGVEKHENSQLTTQKNSKKLSHFKSMGLVYLYTYIYRHENLNSNEI